MKSRKAQTKVLALDLRKEKKLYASIGLALALLALLATNFIAGTLAAAETACFFPQASLAA
jgi:hypothetical protein